MRQDFKKVLSPFIVCFNVGELEMADIAVCAMQLFSTPLSINCIFCSLAHSAFNIVYHAHRQLHSRAIIAIFVRKTVRLACAIVCSLQRRRLPQFRAAFYLVKFHALHRIPSARGCVECAARSPLSHSGGCGLLRNSVRRVVNGQEKTVPVGVASFVGVHRRFSDHISCGPPRLGFVAFLAKLEAQSRANRVSALRLGANKAGCARASIAEQGHACCGVHWCKICAQISLQLRADSFDSAPIRHIDCSIV